MTKPQKIEGGKGQRRWTRYQDQVPCNPDGCCKHYACYLFEMGWRVSLRKFWFIKWLEFTTK